MFYLDYPKYYPKILASLSPKTPNLLDIRQLEFAFPNNDSNQT